MDKLPISTGVPLPTAPPPELLRPVLATPAPASLSRIDGYDFARGLAVLGMTVVNYNVIFRAPIKYALPFSGLANLLYGRPAVLFVMLAGVGLTLLARKPLLAGTTEALNHFRTRIIKRCMVLFVFGGLFHVIWSADVLHFYALYLSLGTLWVALSGRRVLLSAVAFWGCGSVIFSATLGAPSLAEVVFLPGFLSKLLDDLLLCGQYALFPWFSFLLVGIWFGRPEIMNQPEHHRRIFLIALAVFIGSELFMACGESWFSAAGNDESPLACFFYNDPFPASPLFAISAEANAIMVLIFAMYISRKVAFRSLIQGLKNTGKLSLTFYIGHVIIALGLENWFRHNFSQDGYSVAVTCFTLLILIGQCHFANFWCARFERGPLEWLLRRLSGTT